MINVRKLKRKWENVSKNNKMLFLLLGCLCFITVGYAAINQVLKIAGYASIDKGDGMIFTSIGIKENNNASIETDASIKAKTLVNTQIGFTGEGSITFQVSAQNQGTTDAKLIEIKGLNEHNTKEPTCIQASVQDHNIGDLVYPNQAKNFTITITSTCSSYSSKEFDLHFVYEKQETINGVLPVYDLGDKTTELLNNSGDGTYNYMDGTYLKGSQDSNYVWFDGFMWRIMGKNADGSIRMITEENVTGIPWGASNTAQDYDNSYVNDWLNNYFYPKLEHKDLTCTSNLSSLQKPIGLLSLDEYNLASGSSSYLVNSQYFWTTTPNGASGAWLGSHYGSANNDNVTGTNGVRPVIGISSDVTITGGNGTLTDPYIIGEVSDVTGSLKDNGHVGEYVTYAGRNYRVVETSNQGTKLILDGHYDSNNDGTIDNMEYGTNCTLCTTINEESFINWISNNNETDKAKLVSTTWYRGDNFDYGDNYKDNLESTSNPYEGRVGLIRVGEMLSGQSETILSKNHTVSNNYNNAQTYWTSTRDSASSAWVVSHYGFANYNNVSSTNGVRPVIMIHPSVSITGGQGTPNEPYTLGDAPPTAAQYLIKNKLSSDINTSPTNGLFAIDNQGELTTSDSPREYRYIGADPDNYIKFNNELWRIIGIFDGQLKIIRNESLGKMAWDSNNVNDWSIASLQTYLNNDYYGTINSEDQAKIDSNYTWKLGGSSTTDDVTAQMFYERERGTTVYSGRPTEWIESIALMYPSDYGFSTSGGNTTNRSSCLAKELYNWYKLEDCYINSWLYDSSNNQWTLAPRASLSNRVFCVNVVGYVYNVSIAANSYAVRPAVYLLSNVEIVSGIGTPDEPFVLG